MRVIHYLGGAWAGQRLNSCWWRNKARLEALGLRHIPWLDLSTPGEIITKENIGEKLDNPQLAPKLRQWCEEVRKAGDAPRLLFHSDFLNMSLRHQRFKLLHGLLARYFPEATQSVILVPTPADLEVEAALSRQLVNGTPAFSRFFIASFCRKKAQRLRPLLEDYDALVGPDNVQAFIWHEDNSLEREFMLRLTRAMDLDDGLVDGLDLAPSRVPPVLQRDVLCFLESVNPLLARIEKPDPFNWYLFTGFWKAGCMARAALPDEMRRELRSRYDKDDEAALRERFGLGWEAFVPASTPDRGDEDEPGAIFAETGPEADRYPCYADALRIAKKLPEDFLRALAAGPHPEEHLQRAGTRLCLAAIREAARAAPQIEVAMAPQPKVAVLTATYNHASFIAQNIESVLAQKVDFPISHIIADDGSTDGTQDIVLDYAARYPHIRPVFQKTRGKDSRSYQCLFEMARAPYVAICEGDDYFSDKDKLQMQYDFLEANPDCALHFHRVRVTFEHGQMPERIYPMAEHIPGGFRPFYDLDDLVRGNMIQTNSVMYRWRFTDGMPLWYNPYLIPADWYMHLLHVEIGKIGFSEKIMSVYRRHAAAQFYLTEVDRLKHRVKFGKRELLFFSEMDKHFLFKYRAVYRDLAVGVLTDLMQYGIHTDDMSAFEATVAMYPEYGLFFLKQCNINS